MESPATEAELFAFFDSLDIPHQTYRHPPVFTVDEARSVRASMPGGQNGGHSKNLFVRDKKKNYALVVADENRDISLKNLAGAIGLGRLSFASPERLQAYLGVEAGSVTPFALLNASTRRKEDHPLIKVVLDVGLTAHDLVYFHPLHNSATTAVTPDNLIAFIRACGFDPLVTVL